jgi:hypothetical protein
MKSLFYQKSYAVIADRIRIPRIFQPGVRRPQTLRELIRF